MATVLVTGGAGGVGRAVARELTRIGDTPVIADLERGRVRAAAAGAGVDERCAVELDVADRRACEDVVAAIVERHGSIDGVVCCAAVFAYGGVSDLTAEDLDRTFAVNLYGSVFVCQAAARAMIAGGHGGSMVLFSSCASSRANASPAYSASKAAVDVFTREMALAWAGDGIRVNAVAPGPIETEMSREAREDPEITRALMAHTPLRRFAQPEEMAMVATFLLSDAASFMTGAIVPVDGGYLAV